MELVGKVDWKWLIDRVDAVGVLLSSLEEQPPEVVVALKVLRTIRTSARIARELEHEGPVTLEVMP